MAAVEQEIIQNCDMKVQGGDHIQFECAIKPQESRENENPQQSEIISPTCKTTKDNKVVSKRDVKKNKSNSGIPLKLKSVTTSKLLPKSSYQSKIPMVGKVVNVKTLEMQFINTKKRLLQLHMELVDKQRPLLDMHKSLLRTKKELENVGKTVALEDLKIISLKTEPSKISNDSGENLASETAINLKLSIESALQSCARECKKCFTKQDYVVKVLEDVSKSNVESIEFEAKIDSLKKEKEEMENAIENTIKENEKKIDDLITNWSKSVKVKHVNEGVAAKVRSLEETIAEQQKAVNEAETNIQILNRRFDEKKASYEKNIAELQEKHNKMEDDLKKDRKTANDHLLKLRVARAKINELDSKTKDAEDKAKDAANKLKQLENLLREKEKQWLQEKEILKQKEQQIQTQLFERQSSFNTRLENLKKTQEQEKIEEFNNKTTLEKKLQEKDAEIVEKEKEIISLAEKAKQLEDHVERMRKQLQEKEDETKNLNAKLELVSVANCKISEQTNDVLEAQSKITDLQNILEKQTQQISQMQNSLQAHTKLAAGLKIEKDNAIKYSKKLRDILEEARDEIKHKSKIIYKVHEKLELRDRLCEKLKSKLHHYESNISYSDKWDKNRCQMCLTPISENTSTGCSSCNNSEVGKMNNCPQYVSESLIGMSVRKVDQLRMRLNNLRKMQTFSQEKNNYLENSDNNVLLTKQIELGGKLYKVLQDHADQSCEDFINLLKLTVSQNEKKQHHHELNPSNDTDDTLSDDELPDISKCVRFNNCYYTSQSKFSIRAKLDDPLL